MIQRTLRPRLRSIMLYDTKIYSDIPSLVDYFTMGNIDYDIIRCVIIYGTPTSDIWYSDVHNKNSRHLDNNYELIIQ